MDDSVPADPYINVLKDLEALMVDSQVRYDLNS